MNRRAKRLLHDLDQEIREHIELATQENIDRGMTPEEARYAASRKFGNVTRTKEDVREVWSMVWLDQLNQDILFAFRQLCRSPGFTIVAVLTLALGIGANTALFSVVNGVLLNPLPYPRPEQLVSLTEKLPPFPHFAISYPNFLDWTRLNRTFQALAAYRQSDFNLTGSGEAQRVKAMEVSAGFFPLLNVQPLIGRNFLPDEDSRDGEPVVMLSASLWKTKFGASPSILGKALTLDGEGYTVIGVVPEDFYFCCETTNFRMGDVYVPLGAWNVPWMQDRGAHPGIFAIGRLKPGTTLEHARADMDRIASNLAATYPDPDKNIGVALAALREEMVGHVRPMLLVLLAAVGFVFLIACVNVANILLARSIGRAQEFAIRSALGASRGRLVRQLLVESTLLAFAGGTLGLLLAAWGTGAGLSVLPETLPRANAVRVDAHVLAFTVVVSVLAAVLFGLAPILQISGVAVQKVLKEQARGARGPNQNIQRAFVAVEVALAVVLLIGAGLTIRSLATLWSVNPGFDPRNVLSFTVGLPGSTEKGTPDQIRAYFNRLTDAIAGIPGVAAGSRTAGMIPMAGDNEVGFWIEGQAQPPTESEMPNALNYLVGPDYLKAMGIPLLRGRFITSQDNIHSSFVAVIDERFAREYFPNRNPVGEHIHLAGLEELFEVVGVVGHVDQNGLDEDERSTRIQLYTSIAQIPDKFISAMAKSAGFVVRTEVPRDTITEAIRHTIAGMNSQQVAYDFEFMEGIISDSLSVRRSTMQFLAAFAVLAVLLATIGVYGVVSYLVGRRTHEIGVRMALGAGRRRVVLMVLAQAGKMVGLGVIVGLLASLGLSRLIGSMLFRVKSYDPLTFVAVAVALSVVAVVACYIPARRASRVDPMVALRYE